MMNFAVPIGTGMRMRTMMTMILLSKSEKLLLNIGNYRPFLQSLTLEAQKHGDGSGIAIHC
jgi:hypothetical protein